MLDNLQMWYLARLEYAQAAALHDNIDVCLDICFEIRLKSDLALYTRAMVNLTLADACPVEIHPDKAKFALEAQRLAKELREEPSAKDTVWIQRLDELATDAEECQERVQQEVADYRRKEQEQAEEKAKMEDSMQDLQFESPSGQDPEDVSMASTDEMENIVPWQLEGAVRAGFPRETEFGVMKTSGQKATTMAELSDIEEGVKREKADKTRKTDSILPTPEASFQQR